MAAIETKVLADEFYITGTADDASSTEGLFRDVAATLDRHGAQPLSIRAYGPAPAMKEARRSSGLDEGIPVTWLDARSSVRGIQVWAVAGRVSTVGPGRLWSGDGFRALLLSGIRGEGSDAVHQAESMFLRAGQCLQKGGFSWRHAVRTWIYLARLLDWYGDFNQVRTGHFGAVGLDAATGFPASTGIQGRSGGGEECQMDLLAVEGLDTRFIRRTPCQKESFAYGSAFSRGAVLDRSGRRTIHVSGTASIDAAGRTIHLDDPEAQADETLTCVEGVLGTAGAGLRDIVSSTLFCRDEDVMAACLKVLRAGRRPRFPFVPVIAQVCRSDLLVELEAVAVV